MPPWNSFRKITRGSTVRNLRLHAITCLYNQKAHGTGMEQASFRDFADGIKES